jgi:hypothetical protein
MFSSSSRQPLPSSASVSCNRLDSSCPSENLGCVEYDIVIDDLDKPALKQGVKEYVVNREARLLWYIRLDPNLENLCILALASRLKKPRFTYGVCFICWWLMKWTYGDLMG